MSNSEKNNHTRQILTFLRQEGFADRNGKVIFTPLSGDGSSRRFYKIDAADSGTFCGVLPGNQNPKKGLAEAHAAYNIGKHLKKRGLPVPAINGFDQETGFILFEDLGSTLLYDMLQDKKKKDNTSAWQEIRELYKEIVEILLFMQISGSVRFDRKWCWDTQRYDKKLMLEKESGYFAQAFCRDLLGMKNLSVGLTDEFKLLAGRAARQPAVYFLHRDFQSRNIMVTDGELKIIDFQGGRLGPLGYDLASLLIDPYVQLPDEFQQDIIGHYLDHLCTYGLDDMAFLRGYPSLALQRNLQILGAFAFLSSQKQKPFFRKFILPAALSLQQRLSGPDGKDFPLLHKLSEKILRQLDKRKDMAH